MDRVRAKLVAERSEQRQIAAEENRDDWPDQPSE